jgi:hypothetical protein
LVVNRLGYKDERVAPAALGALVPDVVDTTLAWVLHVASTRHHSAHSPLAGSALTLLTMQVSGPRNARSFGTAYLVHLVTDDIHHGRVPWLMPFSGRKRRPHASGRKRLTPWAVGFLLELPAIAVLALLAGAKKRAGTTGVAGPPPDA